MTEDEARAWVEHVRALKPLWRAQGLNFYEALDEEGLQYVPTRPPTDEQVTRALERAAARGLYDPETGRFAWDEPEAVA